MENLQLELTKLLGKKELSFWCKIEKWCRYATIIHKIEWWYKILADDLQVHNIQKPDIIIGHPPTLINFHRFLNEKWIVWGQWEDKIQFYPLSMYDEWIPYDSSKELLDQEESTLKQIISLIREQWNSTNV